MPLKHPIISKGVTLKGIEYLTMSLIVVDSHIDYGQLGILLTPKAKKYAG
jgi:hypothetical protein